MAAATCVRCGVFLATAADVTYSDEGDPMCVACRDRIDLERKERREARTLTGLAFSALGGAIFGLPTAIFFVLGGLFFSLPAFGSAMLCVRGLKSAPPGTLAALGGRLSLVRAVAYGGVALSALGLAILAIQIVEVLLELATRPR